MYFVCVSFFTGLVCDVTVKKSVMLIPFMVCVHSGICMYVNASNLCMPYNIVLLFYGVTVNIFGELRPTDVILYCLREVKRMSKEIAYKVEKHCTLHKGIIEIIVSVLGIQLHTKVWIWRNACKLWVLSFIFSEKQW